MAGHVNGRKNSIVEEKERKVSWEEERKAWLWRKMDDMVVIEG